ncbi:MAG TPA: WD40 repeat domain-containing protein [Opitutaceae bacterium]|jgi:WD40 repeat protein|nr:WD40 repeat domain-containing protein [Opitutaceae bacterium]
MELTKHWAAALDDYVIDLAWSPDNTALAAASAAGPIVLLAAADGKTLHSWDGHPNGTNCLDFAAGRLASGGQDGCVKLWDVAAGEQTASVPLGPAWVDHLAWRPQGGSGGPPLLAAATGRKVVFVASDGTVRHRAPEATKTVSALAWHPSGGALAAAAFGGIRLWDADDFVLQKELPYANGINALAWSPDGRWLVSGNQDPSVHLWMPESDVELQMSGYETKVKHLSFDVRSRWLATSGGQDACLWDCSDPGPEGRAPAMLPHEAPVGAVAFQHAHSLLATAAADGAVMLWSPERQQPLRATIRLPAPAAKLVWSPDDRYLALGTEAGALYVLRCTA